MKKVISIFLLCVFINPVLAKENITFEWLKANSKTELAAKNTIENSEINQIVADLSDTVFPFNKPLTIQYGADDGPLYDPVLHTIMIPYRFYNEAENYFLKNGYQEKFGRSAQMGALDTLLHTLLHEAGHAYVADQNIPILAKEEDAVDNFASILLLEYVDNGDEVAISAADMFAFESDERPEYYEVSDYIDEHSFDLQRYFSTLCLVYGSNEKKYQYLLDEVDKDYLKDRKDFCVEQFGMTTDNWHVYLKATSN